MNNRIKQIRKEKNLTQSEFGAVIGVKGNTVTGYETGLRTPSDAVIMSICREFNVNEQWLRTGEWEMFRQLTRDEEIAAFLGSIIKEDENEFRKRLVSAMAKLDEKDWKEIERLANKLTKKD